jgi:hypothetical protein
VADIGALGIKKQIRISHRNHGIKKRESHNSKHFYPETLLVIVYKNGVGIVFTACTEQKIKQRYVNRK